MVEGKSSGLRVESVALGTWLPRTVLHASEVASALRGERLPGHPRDLPARRCALGVMRVRVAEGLFQRVVEVRSGEVTFSLTEDGVILVETTIRPLAAARAQLTVFYERRLGPFLECLFRRGMPLPKELADVRAVLPFFVFVRGGAVAEAAALVHARGRAARAARTRGPLTVLPGASVTILHLASGTRTESLPLSPAEVIRYATFIREFEEQLAVYLRLHRDVWESVEAIRSSRRLRYRDLAGIRDRLSGQRKTVGFIRARIAQMGDVLEARVRHVAEEKLGGVLEELGLNRFTSLRGARAYLAHLWEETDRYVGDTQELLGLLHEDRLAREVLVLNTIVFGTLITGFFGMNVPFPWEERWTVDWRVTPLVTFLLLVLGLGGFLGLHHLQLRRRFIVREIEKGKAL